MDTSDPDIRHVAALGSRGDADLFSHQAAQFSMQRLLPRQVELLESSMRHSAQAGADQAPASP